MYKFYNPNPLKKSAGDCTVRAISKALGKTWEETYIDLCLQGLSYCDMPSANIVWGAYLKDKGYKKHYIDEISVADFADKHKDGKTYIVGTGSHVVSVCCGDYFDSWDSSNETAIFYFCKE